MNQVKKKIFLKSNTLSQKEFEIDYTKISNPLKIILGSKDLKSKLFTTTDFELIALTREGIKKSSLKPLASFLGINMETLCSLLHTSYRNISRKEDEVILDSSKSERVLELASFAQNGVKVIGSKSAFQEWLKSPLVVLENQTPLQYLDTSFGIILLEKILGRITYGIYS